MAYGPYSRVHDSAYKLYSENNGWKPKGPWWQKVLATIIACVLVILIFAIIFFIGTL